MKYTLFLLLFISSAIAANPDKIAKDLKLNLKEKGEPTASFVYAVRSGNLLFLSGHIPVDQDGKVITGKIGKDLSTEQGAAAARVVGESILATIKQEIGSLSKVKQIVKVTGMLNATPDYTKHSSVMNGFSNLMIEVFGENGKHARAAVGMGSLPLDAAIEIEVVLELVGSTNQD